MIDSCAERIEAWFDNPANEEGDFFRGWNAYWLRSPRANTGRVLYLTKQHVLSRIFETATEDLDIGYICFPGLPLRADAAWLTAFVGNRRLIFFGDLDPADVMIFAWLRARLPAANVIHFGLNDGMQQRIGYSMPSNCQIRLNTPERNAVANIEQFVPDMRDLLGPNAFDVWQNGFKFEVETLLSYLVGVDEDLYTLLTNE